jgi:LysR family glycine cleavage system transcriptional activator
MKSERLLDEWVFPVCSPALLAQHGPIETLSDFAKYSIIHSKTEPWSDWLRRVGGDNTRTDKRYEADDAAATLVAVEQGKGVALARWSLVAADLAAGRLVRPMLPSVQQHNAYYLVAPAENFSLPKVVRFRGWLVGCCSEFPPPTGETLPAD